MGNIHMTKIYQDNIYSIYIYIYLFIYLFIPGKPYGQFFWSIMGFTRNGRFLFNCVFWFLIVKGCSNPLTTPGSDILRQSPKEEFQPEVEQIGSRDPVSKSGHKHCNISHQIWMYP